MRVKYYWSFQSPEMNSLLKSFWQQQQLLENETNILSLVYLNGFSSLLLACDGFSNPGLLLLKLK